MDYLVKIYIMNDAWDIVCHKPQNMGSGWAVSPYVFMSELQTLSVKHPKKFIKKFKLH